MDTNPDFSDLLRSLSDAGVRYVLVGSGTVPVRTIVGVPMNEDTFTVQVMDTGERVHSVQKKTLKTIRTIAAVIIWASVLVPFVKDQMRIAGTLMMKVPNSNFPIRGSDAR